MQAVMNKTFKIRLPASAAPSIHSQDEVRRIIASTSVSLEELRQQCRRLFSLPDDRVWYFKWSDEDDDAITLTEEHELHDLMGLKANEPTINLTIYFPTAKKPAVPSFPAPHFVPWWSQSFGTGSSTQAPPQKGCQRYTARCDNTNTPLRIGEGWYHLPGTTVDLCQTEFDRLDDMSRTHFVCVKTPDDLGQEKGRYETSFCPARHTYGRRCRVNPIHGSSNTELRGWCDLTGSELKVGAGWYHKVGTTYDLCEAKYAELLEADKAAFVCVNKPEDLGDDAQAYRAACPFMSRMGCGDQPSSHPPCSSTPMKSVVQELSEAIADSDIAADFVAVLNDAVSACTNSPPPSLKAEVISGPSIPVGSVVQPGACLEPIWEIRNLNDSGLWTDVRVKPLDPNHFKVHDSGFEVPMLEAGASGLVSMQFQVPGDIPEGQVIAEFGLFDSSGNVFGPTLRLDVSVQHNKVEAKSAAPKDKDSEAEAVQMLMEMGLGNALTCLRAIRDNHGDVNVAAVTLLRAARK